MERLSQKEGIPLDVEKLLRRTDFHGRIIDTFPARAGTVRIKGDDFYTEAEYMSGPPDTGFRVGLVHCADESAYLDIRTPDPSRGSGAYNEVYAIAKEAAERYLLETRTGREISFNREAGTNFQVKTQTAEGWGSTVDVTFDPEGEPLELCRPRVSDGGGQRYDPIRLKFESEGKSDVKAVEWYEGEKVSLERVDIGPVRDSAMNISPDTWRGTFDLVEETVGRVREQLGPVIAEHRG